MKKPVKLTDVELELMTPLWKLGEGTVNDVLRELPAGRKLAYTSVSTVLRILESKKILKSRKEGRGHVYVPVLSREDYETFALNNLVTKVFDGAASSLVQRLLDASEISEDELKSIRKLLDEKMRG